MGILPLSFEASGRKLEGLGAQTKMFGIKVSTSFLIWMCLTTTIVMGCSGGGDGKSTENSGTTTTTTLETTTTAVMCPSTNSSNGDPWIQLGESCYLFQHVWKTQQKSKSYCQSK